jgi:leader peptidase (prepilin peptidase)/N-methyltransferase
MPLLPQSDSLQYPIVESLCGLAFFACARTWGLSPETFVNSLFLAAILILIFTDFNQQILPNAITIPGALVGILLSPFQLRAFYEDAVVQNLAGSETAIPWTGAILGAILSGGILLAVAATYKLVRHRQGLGMGDVKMMAMVGAFLGWRLGLLTIFAGSFLGSIAGVFLILFGGRTLQTKLAFGTFLGAAAAAALFFGPPVLNWYALAP